MSSENTLRGSKLIYVKQQFINDMQNNRQQKVLVNPNFLKIKPHFNKNFLPNQTIHFNPLFQQNGIHSQLQGNVQHHNLIGITNTPVVAATPKVQVEEAQHIVVSTRTKLIKVSQHKSRTRTSSIHTKYKIIRPDSDTKPMKKPKLNPSNRFKLDYRNSVGQNSLHLKKKSPFKRKLPKNMFSTRNLTSNYVNKNGILYKKGLRSLVVVKRCENNLKLFQDKVISIRKQNYKLDKNRRTLTLVSEADNKTPTTLRSIHLGGVTFRRREQNVFVKVNNDAQRILSQAKSRSINILRNKLKKSNIPCPLYRKFGKCRGKEIGTCIRKHNPEQIALCRKFLQGACVNDKCLLSHKVSAEKMPTCKFYLEGFCSKDKCPYLHVKINPKAEICRDFLEGFCKLAANCCKRHQFLCPEFEKSGKCVKKKCQYPHQKVVRKFDSPKLIATKVERKVRNEDGNQVVNKTAVCNTKKEVISRYYEQHSVNVDSSQEQNETCNEKSVSKRKSLGDLPSFIAF